MQNTISISTESTNYNIHLDSIANHIDELHRLISKKALLVTTESIKRLFLDDFLKILKIDSNSLAICVLKDGEGIKDLKHIEIILESAFKAKLNRNSYMIALGGGVITDMVGFASGIYQRGIDFISIPTTLLSMVDASVGGKCGVNNAYGKNLIGLFHQPKAVYIDTSFLSTLPKREINAGVAEIIKIFACFKYERLKDLKNEILKGDILESSLLLDFIKDSVKLKADVVEKDEKEKDGVRALLNYGHTFGHVIELNGNFNTYLHGEAVSMGMVMANELSCKLGILDTNIARDIESLLSLCGLPTRYKIDDVKSFYDAFFLDKKSLDSKLHFVLLESKNGIKANVHNDISKEIILGMLHEFC